MVNGIEDEPARCSGQFGAVSRGCGKGRRTGSYRKSGRRISMVLKLVGWRCLGQSVSGGSLVAGKRKNRDVKLQTSWLVVAPSPQVSTMMRNIYISHKLGEGCIRRPPSRQLPQALLKQPKSHCPFRVKERGILTRYFGHTAEMLGFPENNRLHRATPNM